MAITSYGSIGHEVTDSESSDIEAALNAQNRARSREYTPLIRPPRSRDRDQSQSFLSRHSYSAGVLLSLLSGALFTANNFLINQWQVNVSDVVLVRTVLQMTIYTSICIYRAESLLPGTKSQKFYVIAQGVTGAVCFICSLACVSYMAVPDALCIIFACPVVTIGLSAVLLRDRLNAAKVTAGALLLIGVIFVCKPDFIFSSIIDASNMKINAWKSQDENLYLIGVCLAVIACLTGGVMDVLVAKCGQVSFSVLVNWSAITGLLMSIVYCLTEDSSYILSPRILETTWQQWLTYSGLSVSGLLAFTTLTKSLQLISPNLVASLRCLELVLAFTVQSLITGLLPDVISSLGGFLITLGVLLLAFQEKILHLNAILVQRLKDAYRPLNNNYGEETRILINH